MSLLNLKFAVEKLPRPSTVTFSSLFFSFLHFISVCPFVTLLKATYAENLHIVLSSDSVSDAQMLILLFLGWDGEDWLSDTASHRQQIEIYNYIHMVHKMRCTVFCIVWTMILPDNLICGMSILRPVHDTCMTITVTQILWYSTEILNRLSRN